jgi:hypothetical protein
MEKHYVTIVSGLPRSGTSMMMRMLEAGGMPLLTDNLRAADEDNPRGYYEFEPVKQIDQDPSWVQQARGRAVKMISALLKYLPPDLSYKVIFMRRSMPEILASQRQMLLRRGEPTDEISDERMTDIFQRHLSQVEAWLDAEPYLEVLYVQYDQVVQDPLGESERVSAFLGLQLNVARMVSTVDPELYRQRG